jgi:hypothetical protein
MPRLSASLLSRASRLTLTLRLTLGLAAACAPASLLLGCAPTIGDKCTLSTDCSIQGTRVCDTSQPNGYCTVLSCTANTCPDNAACVQIAASLPGCSYDDYGAPSRLGRAMCMKTCTTLSDCRQAEGYVCASPQSPGMIILDSNQSSRMCMFRSASFDPSTPVDAAAVCSAERPDAAALDAHVSRGGHSEAGEASSDAAGDAFADAFEEPFADAFDDEAAGFDAAPESGAADAPGFDAAPESAAADAPSGS